MANVLKGLPGEPRLQGALQVTDTDETTVLWSVDQNGLSGSAVEGSLTAHSGGGQASALALSAKAGVHVVTTVAVGDDSVKLPASAGKGVKHMIYNAGANSLQVFGTGTDTINGAAAATGVAVGAGKAATFVDYAAGTWFMQLGA